MKRLAIVGALSLMALGTTVRAADKASASGTFQYDDKTYVAAHALAWREGDFLKVVLSDKPFDPKWGEDGTYTDSDLMAHPSASFTITIDAERRELFGIRFRNDAGSGADFRCQGPGLLTLTKVESASVAGAFKCLEHNVTFVAPILATPKPAGK